ncbi:calmodulin-A-like [Drosophila pseudoobscura]|uniref:Calmodulin-A-like n=1 Tax=Drosophila pseudoobscura pseudoobscura TaxID=46245 RepID=A0A6I8V5W8_DROPS|nr:calmodulin-A [Drosophila pseudoobscura]
MAATNLTFDQIEEIREAFQVFDRENKGCITCKELGTVMRSLGQNPTEAELYDMIDEIDLDGDGTIDFSEFLYMMSQRMEDLGSDESLLLGFKIFDRDGNGYISTLELKTTMMMLGEKVTDEEVREIMAEIDQDHDGRISYAEFLSAMRS